MSTDQRESTGATRRNFLIAAGGAGALSIAGCITEGNSATPTGDGLSGSISITGSSTVFPLATAVAEKFQSKHPDVDVSISSTGSGGGFKNHFCPGESDINNASRPISGEEKQLCRDNGVEWHEITVATDALTVVVNNEADWVDCVTVEELEHIWKPNGAEKWSDVRDGWPDREFELFGAASTSGTFDYFTEVIVGEEGAHRKDYEPTEQDRTILQGVESSKHAMGYFGFAYYSQNPDRVKALAIDDGDGTCVEPALETAKSGEYKPLSRPLFTYPSKEAVKEEHVAEFCRFFVEQSANTDLVADEVGYVPNTEEDMQAELDELNQFIEEAQADLER